MQYLQKKKLCLEGSLAFHVWTCKRKETIKLQQFFTVISVWISFILMSDCFTLSPHMSIYPAAVQMYLGFHEQVHYCAHLSSHRYMQRCRSSVDEVAFSRWYKTHHPEFVYCRRVKSPLTLHFPSSLKVNLHLIFVIHFMKRRFTEHRALLKILPQKKRLYCDISKWGSVGTENISG